MSEVWKNFTKWSEKEAKCKECGKIVKSSGNTTNLRRHFERKHIPSSTQKNKLTFERAVNQSTPGPESETLEVSDSSISFVRMKINWN